MSFLVRLIACVAAVLTLSVLAAMAWDGSDDAASAQAQAEQERAAPKTGTP